jgi:hypothetical protein
MSFAQDKSNIESIADKSTEIKNEPKKKKFSHHQNLKKPHLPLIHQILSNRKYPIRKKNSNFLELVNIISSKYQKN